MFDALDGGFGEDGAEVFDCHGEEIAKGVGEDFGAGLEGDFAGEFGKTVPWAGVETVVAAVDAVADGVAEFEGDGAFVFDGEVGDAASRI